MSEEILRVFLEELATVRVVCKRDGCGMSLEMPIDKLTEGKQSFVCVCGAILRNYDKVTGAMEDHFVSLAKVIAAIKKSDIVRCEFILPVKDQPKGTVK
jgi:hypothetical protein